MAFKHIAEVVWDLELFGGPTPDTRALLLVNEGAGKCHQLLVKEAGMSPEGAKSLILKTINSQPLLHCTTPIEQCMMAGLLFADSRPFKTMPPAVLAPTQKGMPLGDLIIASQFPFCWGYRLDFLLVGKSELGNRKLVCVECDGEKFHKTCSMEKWRADREREDYIREWDIEIIRFTGREIWNDAAACADEAIRLLTDWLRAEQSKATLASPVRGATVSLSHGTALPGTMDR